MQHSIKDRDSSESFFMNYPIFFLFIFIFVVLYINGCYQTKPYLYFFYMCVCVPVQKLIIYGEYQKTEMRNTLREKTCSG